MSEESDEAPIDSVDDELPVIEEGSDTMEVGVIEEEKDPLEAALERAELAEKRSLTKMLKSRMYVSALLVKSRN